MRGSVLRQHSRRTGCQDGRPRPLPDLRAFGNECELGVRLKPLTGKLPSGDEVLQGDLRPRNDDRSLGAEEPNSLRMRSAKREQCLPRPCRPPCRKRTRPFQVSHHENPRCRIRCQRPSSRRGRARRDSPHSDLFLPFIAIDILLAWARRYGSSPRCDVLLRQASWPPCSGIPEPSKAVRTSCRS